MSLRTFIKWSGNKSRYLRHLLPYIPNTFNTYFEPFVGSGALFLELEPIKWVINDVNKDCINVWKNIKENPDKIISNFKKFSKNFKPMSNQKKKEYCRDITETINTMKYDYNRASTYLLMTYCVYMSNLVVNNRFYFTGLDLNISVNNTYSFLKDDYFDNLLDVSEYLYETKGHIYNKDYKEILLKANEGDFVFLDPPYIEDHDYGFNYNKDEVLDNKFLQDLYKEVKILDRKKVKWMMTQASTKEIRDRFKDYNIKKFKAYRRGKKTFVDELIIMNY